MVTVNAEEIGHEIACTFDSSSGTLELSVSIDAMPESRDFLVAIPLGLANIEKAVGALVLRASGDAAAVNSEGDPVVAIESSLPGDLDGNGIVDVEDAKLACTMEQVRAVAANAGRKAATAGIATSASLAKGEMEQAALAWTAWAACPTPLQVTEPGTHEHVRVVISLHVPAETCIELMLVARLAGEP